MRAMIKQTIADVGKEHPGFLEAGLVGRANNMFWYYQEEERDEKGKVDFQAVYDRWTGWYSTFVEKNK